MAKTFKDKKGAVANKNKFKAEDKVFAMDGGDLYEAKASFLNFVDSIRRDPLRAPTDVARRCRVPWLRWKRGSQKGSGECRCKLWALQRRCVVHLWSFSTLSCRAPV